MLRSIQIYPDMFSSHQNSEKRTEMNAGAMPEDGVVDVFAPKVTSVDGDAYNLRPITFEALNTWRPMVSFISDVYLCEFVVMHKSSRDSPMASQLMYSGQSSHPSFQPSSTSVFGSWVLQATSLLFFQLSLP
jgi:hypothetical protein